MQDSILKAPSLFEKAEKIVKDCRHKDYGSPTAMCEHIAAMWNAYLGLKDKIKADHVPMLMIMLKIARQAHNYKEDNLIDIMGYAGVAEMVEKGV